MMYQEFQIKRNRELLREARREKRRKEVHRSIAYLVLLILMVTAAFIIGIYVG